MWVNKCDCVFITEKGVRADRVHGLRSHDFYNTWQNMCQRTSNPKNDSWEYYGGRGIGMCIQWRKSFLCFLKSMPEKRNSSLTIDRIDNNKGYCPHNIRLADATTQQLNKSSNGKYGRCVYWHKRDKVFVSYMQVNKKRFHIGNFKTAKEAVDAFIESFKEWYGFLPYGV